MRNARFSQHVRRALHYARVLAQKHHHGVIDTDHIILGIWRTEGSLGWQALRELSVDLTTADTLLRELHPQQEPSGTLPYSEAVEQAFVLAKDEAYWLGHHYIGTEHVLLGTVRSGAGQGAVLLRELQLTGMQIRRRVRRLLNEGITELNIEAARRLARLSELSRRVLNAAAALAREQEHPAPHLEHLLLVLAREKRSMAAQYLLAAGLDVAQLNADLALLSPDPLASMALDELIDSAVDQAEALGSHYTGTDHVLLAMLHDRNTLPLLHHYQVDTTALREKLSQSLKK